MPMPDPDVLTTEEVAEALGVHRTTITRWVKAGIAEPDHRGKRPRDPWYWKPETVAQLVPRAAEPP